MPPEPTATASIDALGAELHQHVVTEHLDPATDRDAVLDHLRRMAPLLGAVDEVQVLAKVADRVAGLGTLATLLDDQHTTDLLVNGPGAVWVERSGRLVETDITIDDPEIRRIIERITAPTGRRADLRNPVVDVRLVDGSRAHIVLPPVAVDGPYLAIRRFASVAVPLSDFGPTSVIDVLRAAVRGRANIVISGGTGSGKTTLLNALCEELGADERIITVEDAAELRIPGNQVVRLETRPASSEGLEAITIGDLVRTSLRMRPDRVIVGEVRGHEAIDMLWAMNTGHDGSMTTCHANSPADAIRRLEAMALSAQTGLDHHGVRRRIHAAVDLIVQVTRRADGRRCILSISEPSDDAESVEVIEEIADSETVRRVRRRPARTT